jgi:hypothetical protein
LKENKCLREEKQRRDQVKEERLSLSKQLPKPPSEPVATSRVAKRGELAGTRRSRTCPCEVGRVSLLGETSSPNAARSVQNRLSPSDRCERESVAARVRPDNLSARAQDRSSYL